MPHWVCPAGCSKGTWPHHRVLWFPTAKGCGGGNIHMDGSRLPEAPGPRQCPPSACLVCGQLPGAQVEASGLGFPPPFPVQGPAASGCLGHVWGLMCLCAMIQDGTLHLPCMSSVPFISLPQASYLDVRMWGAETVTHRFKQ